MDWRKKCFRFSAERIKHYGKNMAFFLASSLAYFLLYISEDHESEDSHPSFRGKNYLVCEVIA